MNKMEYLNLSILEKTPDLSQRVLLEIEPLAPLSMVSELPGSYYKTLKSPNEKMLCGLFENILGWHIDLADRKLIINDLKNIRKENAKKNPQMEFIDKTTGSSYSPLLIDYFEILIPIIPELVFYDDLWKKAYRRSDAEVHPKGTFNLDHRIIPLKRQLARDKDKPRMIENKALLDFFIKNIHSYPLFYTTPSSREYVSTKGKYIIQIAIDPDLYKILCDRIMHENIGYLGNSEGWVELNFNEL